MYENEKRQLDWPLWLSVEEAPSSHQKRIIRERKKPVSTSISNGTNRLFSDGEEKLKVRLFFGEEKEEEPIIKSAPNGLCSSPLLFFSRDL